MILTEDHPVFTGENMIPAAELQLGDSLITRPFEGVRYESPPQEVIIDEEKILSLVGNRPKIIASLEARGLLPLRMDSKHIPVLAKLVGFITGDGWLGSYRNEKIGHDIWSIRIIGKPEDLEEVRQDIASLGYEANYTRTMRYTSKIKEAGGKERNVDGISTQLHSGSQALSVLLHALGVPKGNKSKQAVSVPSWVKRAPLWIKRLYLAGLFGAEMTGPHQRKGEEHSFTEPSFSQNKIVTLAKENERFLLEIRELLGDFGVRVNKLYRQRGAINVVGQETVKHALHLSATQENLLNLWSRIGFEYCAERRRQSILAIAYIKKKRSILARMQSVVDKARGLVAAGGGIGEAIAMAHAAGLSATMAKAQLYKSSVSVRIPSSYPTFSAFCAEASFADEFVMDRVEKIEDVSYDGFVYDFTMDDADHNFIANSIVSHNCGMRLITTNLTFKEVKPKLKELVDGFFRTVPAGVGVKGFVQPSRSQFDDVLVRGTQWCVDNGYGWKEDVPHTESNGRMEWADPAKVSDRAKTRGLEQLGTLGSGNHYLEIQVAEQKNIVNQELAEKFGITKPDQVVVMVHCGSRGFGHQIGTDYLRIFEDVMRKHKISVPDRELACAPFQAQEGQDYFKAMACAANMAFANRQVILHRIREGFAKSFHTTAEKLEMNLIYDVAHNTAKLEKHMVDGKLRDLVVHRKGATRAFGPGNPELAPEFQKTGQPVILGGSMETGSWLLTGTQKAMEMTWGSTAHGSGRTMSRTQAKREVHGGQLQKQMEDRGIYVRATSMAGLAEEAGRAYKDINAVVDAVEKAGLCVPVVGLRPVGNVKG